jgi:hypothetical protein
VYVPSTFNPDDSFTEKMIYVEGVERAEKAKSRLKQSVKLDAVEIAIQEKRRLVDVLQTHAERFVWERRQKQRWKLINEVQDRCKMIEDYNRRHFMLHDTIEANEQRMIALIGKHEYCRKVLRPHTIKGG